MSSTVAATTIESQNARAIAKLRADVAQLQRSTISAGGTGVGGVVIGDVTGNVPGTLTINPASRPRVSRLGINTDADATCTIEIVPSGAGAAAFRIRDAADTTNRVTINETGAVKVETLGVGVAAGSDALTVAAFAGLAAINDDHGEAVNAFTGGPSGAATTARYYSSEGTTAAPFTGERPGLLIYRTIRSATTNGANIIPHAAVMGVTTGVGTDQSAAPGICGAGIQLSTNTLRADSTGAWAIGVIGGSSPGFGFGAYFEGKTIAPTGGACALELQATNYEPTPTSSTYNSASIGPNRMKCLQLQATVGNVSGGPVAGNILGGSGILFYLNNPAINAQYDVGIGVTAGNSPIKNSTLRDDGASLRCIDIRGTHSTASIEVANGSGQVRIGSAAAWGPAAVVIKPTLPTDNALILMPQTSPSTQSVSVFSIVDTSNAPAFSVSHTGRVGHGAAGTYAYLNFPTGSANYDGIRFGHSATSTDNVFVYQSAAGTISMDGKFVVAFSAATDQLLVGVSSASTVKAVVKAGASTDNALRVMGAASQSVSTLIVTDSAGAELWSVAGATGAMRALHPIQLIDTTDEGYVRFPSQSGTIPTPGTAGVHYLHAVAEGTSAASARPHTSVLRTTDSAGVKRTLLQSLGDGCPIIGPRQTYNTVAGLISVTLSSTVTYFSEMDVIQPTVFTGVRYIPSTVGSSKLIASLHDPNGVVVATSALAGTTSAGTAGQWQALDFTAQVRANQPGSYYVSFQSDGAGTPTAIYTYPNGSTATDIKRVGAGSQTSTTFGTVPTITPPTAATGSVGPYVSLY